MAIARTAWVPADNDLDYRLPTRIAVAWVEQRCRDERASAVLVTPTLYHLHDDALTAFESRHDRTSPRSRRSRVGSGIGPVLSYLPDAKELALATRLARDSSLAVVESASFPLAGWAAWLGAWDLVADAATGEPSQDIRALVEHLVFQGNNGYGDDYGRRRADSIVRRAHQEGVEIDRDYLAGAVLAGGVSASGAVRLAQIIDRTGVASPRRLWASDADDY